MNKKVVTVHHKSIATFNHFNRATCDAEIFKHRLYVDVESIEHVIDDARQTVVAVTKRPKNDDKSR